MRRRAGARFAAPPADGATDFDLFAALLPSSSAQDDDLDSDVEDNKQVSKPEETDDDEFFEAQPGVVEVRLVA